MTAYYQLSTIYTPPSGPPQPRNRTIVHRGCVVLEDYSTAADGGSNELIFTADVRSEKVGEIHSGGGRFEICWWIEGGVNKQFRVSRFNSL